MDVGDAEVVVDEITLLEDKVLVVVWTEEVEDELGSVLELELELLGIDEDSLPLVVTVESIVLTAVVELAIPALVDVLAEHATTVLFVPR